VSTDRRREFRPPPAHVQDRVENRYPLDLDGTVVLIERIDVYRGRIYFFCLKLVVVVDGEDQEVERIDTCHREVHRHLMSPDGDEIDRISICPFQPGDYSLVEEEHRRAYDDYLNSYEHRVRRVRA
jgi:hypothetical protein